MATRQRKMKRIMEIRKITSQSVEVEYFDGAINGYNTAIRVVNYPSANTYDGAYINWFGEKVDVEGILT